MGLADSAGNDGNGRQQLGRLDRFGDVVDVTGPQRPRPVFRAGECRERNRRHRCRRPAPHAEPPQKLVAVDVRHADVADHELRFTDRAKVERCSALDAVVTSAPHSSRSRFTSSRASGSSLTNRTLSPERSVRAISTGASLGAAGCKRPRFVALLRTRRGSVTTNAAPFPSPALSRGPCRRAVPRFP